MKATITLTSQHLTKTIELEGAPDEVSFILDIVGQSSDSAYQSEDEGPEPTIQ